MAKARKKAADLIAEWKKDPEWKKGYDALAPEFERARLLIQARTQAGLTQAEVAERMGVTQPAVARLESGKRKPSLSTLERYADAVGCEVRLDLVKKRRSA